MATKRPTCRLAHSLSNLLEHRLFQELMATLGAASLNSPARSCLCGTHSPVREDTEKNKWP